MPTTRKPRAKKPPAPLERDVQKSCIAVLKLRQIPHIRLNAGAAYRPGRNGKPQLIRYAPEGFPDLLGWLPAGFGWAAARVLGVEVKREGQRPKQEQLAVLRRILDDGGVGVWVTDSQQLERVLDGVKEGKRVELTSEGIPYLTDEPRN
jgi:hypothetical protein